MADGRGKEPAAWSVVGFNFSLAHGVGATVICGLAANAAADASCSIRLIGSNSILAVCR
jgi:hypothetical protein